MADLKELAEQVESLTKRVKKLENKPSKYGFRNIRPIHIEPDVSMKLEVTYNY